MLAHDGSCPLFLDVYWHEEKIPTWVSQFKPHFAHLLSFLRLRWLSCRRCCQLLQLRKIPWCLSWTRFAAWFCLVGQIEKSQKWYEMKLLNDFFSRPCTQAKLVRTSAPTSRGGCSDHVRNMRGFENMKGWVVRTTVFAFGEICTEFDWFWGNFGI